MFGPDKCGEDYKLHFIFRHKNPKTGEYEEKHAKKPDSDLRTYYTDKKTHLYTLGKTSSPLVALPVKLRIHDCADFARNYERPSGCANRNAGLYLSNQTKNK